MADCRDIEKVLKEVGYIFNTYNVGLVANYLDTHQDQTIRSAIYWLADKLEKETKNMEISAQVKIDLRQLALDTALKIRPTEAFASERAIDISAKATLKECDIIYDWLVKDL